MKKTELKQFIVETIKEELSNDKLYKFDIDKTIKINANGRITPKISKLNKKELIVSSGLTFDPLKKEKQLNNIYKNKFKFKYIKKEPSFSSKYLFYFNIIKL